VKGIAVVVALVLSFGSVSVWTGYGVGNVGQGMVERVGDQVYVELTSASITSWPCALMHPSGFRYAFLISQAREREMLATILAAKAAGQALLVVGSGERTIDRR